MDEDALTDEATYHLRARAYDGNTYSGWSSWTTATASILVVDEIPDFTEQSIAYDHAVSLEDAINVMAGLSYEVVGYEFENDDLIGAYYPADEYDAADFLAGFAADYDTVPEITAVVVLAPTVQTVSARLGADVSPPVIPTGKPVLDAPLADGTAVVDFDAAMEAAGLQDGASGGRVAAMTSGTSSGFSRWDPGIVTTKIFKAGTATNKLLKLTNYYYWNGTTTSPKKLNEYKTYDQSGDLKNYFGLEFENNIWGTHYPSDQLRCQNGTALGNPDCSKQCNDVDASRKALVAYNQGYSYAVRYGNSTSPRVTDLKGLLGTYADTNDVWDQCNKNSIAVGVQHPENIPATSPTDKSVRLYIDVTTSKGTDNSDQVTAGVQVLAGHPCLANPTWSRTDCMGAVAFGLFAFTGSPNYRPVLSAVHKWTAPSLCWTSAGYGGSKFPPTRKYTDCAVSPSPWQ